MKSELNTALETVIIITIKKVSQNEAFPTILER